MKPVVLKNLDELNRPSPGTELIQKLQDSPKPVVDVSIIPNHIVQESVTEPVAESTEEILDKSNQYAGFIKDGVEVVDVKRELQKKTRKLGMRVDKWGIPINPGEHRNFDKI